LHHLGQHGLNFGRRQGLWASGPESFLQSSQAQIQHALTPLAHSHMAGSQLGGDLLVVFALGSQQGDAGTPDDFLRSARRLLEPLPFLVFLSLARYVQSFLQSDGQANSNDTLSGCGTQLHRVKTLVVALMTASVATDLLRRAIEDVSLLAAAAEGLVMLLLGSYWFALEKVCQPHCKKSASDQQ
jgi:hypothetical protein